MWHDSRSISAESPLVSSTQLGGMPSRQCQDNTVRISRSESSIKSTPAVPYGSSRRVYTPPAGRHNLCRCGPPAGKAHRATIRSRNEHVSRPLETTLADNELESMPRRSSATTLAYGRHQCALPSDGVVPNLHLIADWFRFSRCGFDEMR